MFVAGAMRGRPCAVQAVDRPTGQGSPLSHSCRGRYEEPHNRRPGGTSDGLPGHHGSRLDHETTRRPWGLISRLWSLNQGGGLVDHLGAAHRSCGCKHPREARPFLLSWSRAWSGLVAVMINDDIRLGPEGDDAAKRRRSLLTAVGCVSCIGIGNSAVAAVLPALARELGISELASGFIVSASPVVYLFAAPFWGRRADRVGSRVVLVIGMTGYSVGALLFALGVSAGLQAWIAGYILVSALMVARIVNSSLGAGLYPAAVALAVSGSAQNERARIIAALSAGYGAGMMLGPGIAAALVPVSLAAPYYFISFLVLLTTGLASRLTVAEQPKQKRTGRPLSMLDRRIVRFLFVAFALFLVLSMLHVVLGFVVYDKIDASTAAQRTGVLFMIVGLCALLSQIGLMRLKGISTFIALNIGLSTLAGGLFLLALGETIEALAIGAALVGFGLGVSGPMSSAACSLALDQDEQGSGAGFMDSARSAGSITGPLIGGATYPIGPEVPLFIGIGFSLGVIGLLVAWESRIRHGGIDTPRRPG